MSLKSIFKAGFVIVLVISGGIMCSKTKWQPADGPLLTRWAGEVNPENVLPEYPRPQMVREEWLNLNGLWDIAFEQEKDKSAPKKDSLKQILVPFPVESALSGIKRQETQAWYQRQFKIPKDWQGKHIVLHFGAVDWESDIFLNGKKIGSHKGGYDPFYFDITDALKENGNQNLVVSVFDQADKGKQARGKQVTEPRGIWYTPTTGIWQTVWLEPVNEISIEDFIITPDIDNEKLSLIVKARGNTENCTIHAEALDGEKIISKADGIPGEKLMLEINNPNLWTPDNPYLYDLTIKISKNNKVVDEIKSYFGMRKISLGKEKSGITRMMLNNEFVFQLGPLDQGFWPDGLYTAPTDEALKYDIEITKKLGFNMARKHVKVEPDRWYYWCDKLGLLVWQDMPSGINSTPESKPQFELELKNMIKSFRNHPSIIMWVVFNEGWGQYDTEKLVKYVKELDPSRLVNSASGWSDKKVGDIKDIHSYPGPAAPDPEPKRAAVLGEFGGLGLKIEGHTWQQSTWGYRTTANREHLTRKYQLLLKKLYPYIKNPGLSAAVYTQTTDVETEANGLMTYDREIIKMDIEKVISANSGNFSDLPDIKVVVPTSEREGLLWKYTFKKPEENWYKPEFDDSGWKTGKGGFGKENTPGAVIGTEWTTDNIWLRREFNLPEGRYNKLQFYLHHDEDAKIYINGVLAAEPGRYTSGYEDYPITAEALAVLKPGKNIFAVYCKNSRGGQYIDVGIIDFIEK